MLPHLRAPPLSAKWRAWERVLLCLLSSSFPVSQSTTTATTRERRRPESEERAKLLHPMREEEEMSRGCCLAEIQAPIQAFLRPGVWLPGVRRLHLAGETWLIDGSIEQSMEDVLNGVKDIQDEERLQVHNVDKEKGFIQIYSFTQLCNWLDVVEINFRAGEQRGTTIAEAVSFSSGFLPVCCPFSFLFNMMFFWVPFSGNGVNTHRLNAIRGSLQLTVTVTDEIKCNCCPS